MLYVVGRNEGLRDFFNQLMKAVIRCAKKTSSVIFVVPSGLLPSKAVKSGRGRNLALKPCPSVSPRPSLFPPLRLFRWGGSRRKSRPRGREKRPNKTSPLFQLLPFDKKESVSPVIVSCFFSPFPSVNPWSCCTLDLLGAKVSQKQKKEGEE